MSLSNPYTSQAYSPAKLLQEVGNDDEFMQLPNITTTYLEVVPEKEIHEL